MGFRVGTDASGDGQLCLWGVKWTAEFLVPGCGFGILVFSMLENVDCVGVEVRFSPCTKLNSDMDFLLDGTGGVMGSGAPGASPSGSSTRTCGFLFLENSNLARAGKSEVLVSFMLCLLCLSVRHELIGD